MKDKIKYIKERLDKYGNVSIHTGKLTIHEMAELSKHFNLEKQPFGYTKFSNKIV